MSELTIHPRVGVGDLLILKDFLSSYAMGSYSSINLHFQKTGSWGRSIDYSVFRDQLVATLYSEDIFNIVTNSHKAPRSNGAYYRLHVDGKPKDIKAADVIKLLNFKGIPNLLCDDHNYKEDYGENYVVLSTRIRDLPVDDNLVRKILLALGERYNKILIIGENQRGLVMLHSNIYSAIISQKSFIDSFIDSFGEKIIDLTTDKLSFEGFKKENAIMRDAAMTVILGWGGNMCRQIYINNNNMACVYANGIHPIMDRLKGASHHCYPNSRQGYQDFFKRITS